MDRDGIIFLGVIVLMVVSIIYLTSIDFPKELTREKQIFETLKNGSAFCEAELVIKIQNGLCVYRVSTIYVNEKAYSLRLLSGYCLANCSCLASCSGDKVILTKPIACAENIVALLEKVGV